MFATAKKIAEPTGAKWMHATLADAEYEFLCKLIYEKSRINLGPDKRVLLTSRLSKRLQDLRMDGYGEYCALLRSTSGADELQMLIDRISTNHTHFFREQQHFDFLRDKFLPAWQADPQLRGGTLRVWSAASSTGEEPYSLAIHLAEHHSPPEKGAWKIDASDISTRVLATAKQGIYDTERLKGVSTEQLRRHFQKGDGEWDGHYRVKPELRSRMQFHHLNLLEPPYPFSQPFHLIVCRNVMIYFDRPTQTDLVQHLADCLIPGGYLLVGHSESLSSIKHPLKLVQPAVYLKPKA